MARNQIPTQGHRPISHWRRLSDDELLRMSFTMYRSDGTPYVEDKVRVLDAGVRDEGRYERETEE